MEYGEVCPRFSSHAGLVGLEASHDVLQRRGAQEVLLLQTQLLALHHLAGGGQRSWVRGQQCVRGRGGKQLEVMLTYVVVWVENPCDVFGKVAVQYCLDVVSVIDCSQN